MNQMDPNNISGLLKMHLREKNLLCDKSIQNIGQVITQDMVRNRHTYMSLKVSYILSKVLLVFRVCPQNPLIPRLSMPGDIERDYFNWPHPLSG